MPSAGRIAWNTSWAGRCTTYRHSEVRVSTLTSTLVPSPKKALVSPLTHSGTADPRTAGANLTMRDPLLGDGGGNGRQHGQEVGRHADPTEDAALRGDHVEADPVELGEVGAHAVGEHETLVPAVVGLPDGGVH